MARGRYIIAAAGVVRLVMLCHAICFVIAANGQEKSSVHGGWGKIFPLADIHYMLSIAALAG